MIEQPIYKEAIYWKGHGCYNDGFCSLYDENKSRCLVQVFQRSFGHLVVFSDFNWKPKRASITNSVENIASLVERAYKLKRRIFWLEHYYNEGSMVSKHNRETIDLVALENKSDGWYRSPAWCRIKSRQQAQSIFGLKETVFEPISENSVDICDLSVFQGHLMGR